MPWPTRNFRSRTSAAGRSRSRRCGSRNLYPAASVRRLRIEQLEDRRLLSVGIPDINGPSELDLVGAADSFTIVVLPDTQFYSQTYPAQFTAQTEWIADHIDENNLAFVSHVGDVVFNAGGSAGNNYNQLEWTRADAAMDLLDGDVAANPDGLIPYSVLPGNHDIGGNHESTGRFIEFFGSSRYEGRSWYGGQSPNQTSQYQIFSAGGRDFLHIGLEWTPRESTFAWAQDVLDAYPDLPVILSTHYYLSSSGRSATGNEIFGRLVRANPQVFMVLGGHAWSEYHQVSYNDAGMEVIEMLADFSGRASGGNGWMRLIEFLPEINRIAVKTYSPTLNRYETDGNSQFSFDIDFEQRLGIGSSEVIGRHVFYNNSAFDGNDAAAGAEDDQAIAPDKQALLPGQTATFANYTSFSRGLNGIVIDVAELADPVALNRSDDFEFRVGNNGNFDGWTDAPDPLPITVRGGAGVDGSDRVTIRFEDNAIEGQWLQVTVLATPHTGLREPDVFYFGNAPGEAGDQTINAIVNAADEIAARNFQHGAVDHASIDDPYDYNRDGLVNGTDQMIARENQTNPLTMLKLLAPVDYDVVSLVPEVAELAYLIPGESDAESDWFSRDFADIGWNGTGDATIVITETDSGTPDYVEIQNVSGSYVDTSGWVVAVNMGTTGDIDRVHATYWHLPERMAPNEILYRTDSLTENYFGVGILWSTIQTGWAMILDAHGQVVDFMPWNYSVSQIAAMDTTVNGFPVTGQGLWAGDTAPRAANFTTPTAQRIGNTDRDTVEDFVFTVYDPASRGAPNPGLNTPFGPSPDQIVHAGVGFSADPADFAAAIRTDVGDEMPGVNPSMWMRIPFDVADPAALIGMTLRMQYNDGFVAYLNGREIARRNAPDSPQWNSTATATRSVEQSLDWETFGVSRYIDELVSGTNVLAIHGLNASIDDGDFLIVPRLDAAVARDAKATGPTVSEADLDWLYEFERTNTRNARPKRSSVEETVDMLLATDSI